VVFSKELAGQLGWKTPRQTCEELAARIPGTGLKPVFICPWGSAGAGAVDANGSYHEMASYKQEKVVDTLGAGDSFMAGFIYATLEGQRSVVDAVDFANQVASHKITGFGYDHIAQLSLD